MPLGAVASYAHAGVMSRRQGQQAPSRGGLVERFRFACEDIGEGIWRLLSGHIPDAARRQHAQTRSVEEAR